MSGLQPNSALSSPSSTSVSRVRADISLADAEQGKGDSPELLYIQKAIRL